MSGFLETTIDKFTFRVDPTCLYSGDGIWVRVENGRVRMGMSDYLQQRSGDIAFVDLKPAGTVLAFDEEFASIETVKVNVGLITPVAGEVVGVNPALNLTPEIINQDPFGEGWLCEVSASSWEADRLRLLDADGYFEKMKREAAAEVGMS
jgi:glycine cleavage system H protein